MTGLGTSLALAWKATAAYEATKAAAAKAAAK